MHIKHSFYLTDKRYPCKFKVLYAGFDLYAPGSDLWKTQFRAIDCPRAPGVNGNVKFRFVESNQWAMKLQTRNSRQAVYT